jgi:hypothetical protein
MPSNFRSPMPKPQGGLCNPRPRPLRTGSKTESCRASCRNWIENLRTGASSTTHPESRTQEAAGNRRGGRTQQVGGIGPRSQIWDGNTEIERNRVWGGGERRKGEIFWSFGIEEEVMVGEKKLMGNGGLVSLKFFWIWNIL